MCEKLNMLLPVVQQKPEIQNLKLPKLKKIGDAKPKEIKLPKLKKV
mgnify:CR=1 FL=1